MINRTRAKLLSLPRPIFAQTPQPTDAEDSAFRVKGLRSGGLDFKLNGSSMRAPILKDPDQKQAQ